MTPDEILDRAQEIANSDRTQGSERVLAAEVIRLRRNMRVTEEAMENMLLWMKSCQV